MSLNIMIVDDSSVVRKMILKTLRLGGVPIGEVHQGSNGREGLEILDEHWVDLVLADINMPEMDGEEMIRRIRANPAWEDMAIIIVSTEGSETRIKRLTEMGAKFISKPFKPETVRNVVIETLGMTHE